MSKITFKSVLDWVCSIVYTATDNVLQSVISAMPFTDIFPLTKRSCWVVSLFSRYIPLFYNPLVMIFSMNVFMKIFVRSADNFAMDTHKSPLNMLVVCIIFLVLLHIGLNTETPYGCNIRINLDGKHCKITFFYIYIIFNEFNSDMCCGSILHEEQWPGWRRVWQEHFWNYSV